MGPAETAFQQAFDQAVEQSQASLLARAGLSSQLNDHEALATPTRQVCLILAVTLLAIVAISQASAQQPHKKKAPKRRVPSGLVNRPLNKDENRLDALGIGFKTKGGGLFGIVVKSDWGVCATIPSAGQVIHGPIELVVGHYTCGVK